MTEQILTIENSKAQRMICTLTVPDGPGPHPAVLFVHGLGGHRNERHVVAVCNGLVARGILTLRVDLTNNRGDSDGRFEDMTLSGEVRDATDAFEYFISIPQVDSARVGIAGHSFGGLVSALVASADRRVRAVAPLSPVFDMRRRLESMLGAEGLAEWQRTGYRELGGGMRQGYQFWEDLRTFDVESAVRQIQAPMFVLIGSGRDEIPISEAGSYVRHAASKWKRFEVVHGANHTYGDYRHLSQVVSSTSEWMASSLARD